MYPVREADLYQKVRKKTPDIIWNRIENISVPGMPDALAYNKNHYFFTVEFKATKGYKLRFRPHQIAWHLQHPKHTFILAKSHGQRSVKLFQGSQIRELVDLGEAEIMEAMSFKKLRAKLDHKKKYFVEYKNKKNNFVSTITTGKEPK